MATIDREGGLEVVIRTADHGDPHVHVLNDKAEIKINLSPVELVKNKRMRMHDARDAVGLVERKRDAYLAKWREIHG